MRGRRPVEDFAAEIEAHLQIEADRLVQEEGMDRRQAELAARRAFGNVTHGTERFYEARRFRWLEDFFKDVRLSIRQLCSTPVSTVTIVASLALGLGANTALFSLADQALVRALPVPSPERLVRLEWNGRFMGGGVGSGDMPHALFRELSDAFQSSIGGIFASHPTVVHLAVEGSAEPTMAEIVSGSYFPSLGVRAHLGRLLEESDDVTPGAHPVAVISFELWQSRFASDTDIVGRQLLMNNTSMTVVGVTEPGFHGMDWGRSPGIWVPIMMKREATPGWDALDERRTRWLDVFARLRDGTSAEDLEARVTPWFDAYLEADTRRDGWPETTDMQLAQYFASRLGVAPADRGVSVTRRRVEKPLLVLFAATALVLLLACLNVANLSLAAALSRRRTTALRVALGASRRRIAFESLLQSALLAIAGCSLGAAMVRPLGLAILTFVPQQTAGATALSASFDLRVFCFALLSTSVATLLAGAGPVMFQARVEPVTVLNQATGTGARGLGLRRLLVVGQFTLALILLVGAGLFSRTLSTLKDQGPGFSTSNLLMFRLHPMNQGYDAVGAKEAIHRVLQTLEAEGDHDSVGVGRWELLAGSGWANPVTLEARDRIVTEVLSMNAVSPGFFDALGASVFHGRDFTARDAREEPGWQLRSAIVNEEFVRRYLPEQEPLGARLAIGDTPDIDPRIEIVGVVRSFHDFTLREPRPQVYFPLWERSVGSATFYVRTRRVSESAADSIRAAVQAVDPTITVVSLRAVDAQLDRMLVNERMLATLASAFAMAATLLAVIGLYAVLSFSAARRTKEIGIRIALGAPRWAATRPLAREAFSMAAGALALALPLSWGLGLLIESQLFGVRPADPATIAQSAGTVLLVCGIATAIAARKAMSHDTVAALRLD